MFESAMSLAGASPWAALLLIVPLLAGSAHAANYRHIPWSDPREGAFTLEVPDGWKIDGGLHRFASVDVRPDVVATAPDGSIRISGGDREIPSFALPSQMLSFSGFTEGKWYAPGTVKFLVQRYMTGAEFARTYVRTKVAAGARDLKFVEVRDLPDATRALNRELAQAQWGGMASSASLGEVAFTCTVHGQPFRGYYLAATLQSHNELGGLWFVTALHGYLAAESQVADAQSILRHMLATFEYNPQWVASQQGTTMKTSQIVTQTNNQISQMISDTYWNRQKSIDRVMQRDAEARRGVSRYVDPDTGREYSVTNGSNYYWVDYRGNVVGTDTDTLPGPNFRPIQPVNP